MRKITFSLICLLTTAFVFAQDSDEEEKKEGWTNSGNVSLLFNQSAFNAEWTGGGSTNYAGNLTVTYDLNYKKGKITWDNRFMGDFGMTQIRGEEFGRKTNDRLEVNSIFGRQIKETLWSYSFFLNFRTQFAKGYNYNEDVAPITRVEYTRFLSPGYFQFGPGVLWKKNDNLKINFAPATARIIFVDSRFTSTPGYVDGDYFGVDANKSSRFEFGASLSGYAKFNIMENISVENTLNLYSNYLEDTQNVDIDYTMNLVMNVNKVISANLIFQAIYDDNAVAGFQIREVFGVGVNFGI